MLSLAFTPTAVIGLNKNHDMPKINFTSHVKPSQFAYTPALVVATTEKVEKVATAVLSTTAKAKARAQAKEAKDKANAMDVDGAAVAKSPELPAASAASSSSDAIAKESGDDKMDVDGKDAAAAAAAAKEKEKKPEPSTETLENPARVLPAQAPYVKLEENSRYKAIKKVFSSCS